MTWTFDDEPANEQLIELSFSESGRLDDGADGQQRDLDRGAPRDPGRGLARVPRRARAGAEERSRWRLVAERAYRRLTAGRIVPAILLVAVAAVCWAITARRMQGMDMGPGTDLGGLGWFAVVWTTMMAAMMLPSLVPMALTYAGASRDAGASSPTAATCVFAGGYLLTWLGAGVLAYGLIQGVRSLDLSWLAWDQGGPVRRRRRDPGRGALRADARQGEVPAPLPQSRVAHPSAGGPACRAPCRWAWSTAASASARAGR